MVRETFLTPDHLVAPLFVKQSGAPEAIPSMPGQFRLSIEDMIKEARSLEALGVLGVALFPVIESSLKDARASYALKEEGLYLEAIRALKAACPQLLVMSDVALDPYSSDGHDGLVEPQTGRILNDPTLEILAEMARLQAGAGADLIGPSDMMDGRVAAIRERLDQTGHEEVGIISYTAKYASSYYGPFRDALDSAPKSGDKKTYQMDFANIKEALREAKLDEDEGADILMVKPGGAYLDVLYALSEATNLPTAVYQVSGEYAMIAAACEKGWLEREKVVLESLTAFRRAGARVILTYFAKEAAQLLS